MENIEYYWAMVSYASLILEMIVMGYCFYYFAKPFMVNKRGVFVTGVAYSVTMLLLYLVPLELNNFMAYSIGILAAFFVMCRIDQRNYQQKVFIAVTFFSLRWLSVAMAAIIYNIGYRFVIDTVYMAEHPNIQFAMYAAAVLFRVVLEITLIAISVWYILKAYVYKRETMTKKEMFMLIVPSLTGMTGYGILQYYQNFYEVTIKVSGIYEGLALLHYGISIITIVIMIVIFQNIKARQQEGLENELLTAQVENMKQHIAQMESLYQNIRSIRHDMTNHIMTLERLYANNEADAAKAYVLNLKASFREGAGEIKSGNPVTDVILSERKKEAEVKKIRFVCDFHYPSGSNVNAFDVSVILNNALENAIEATENSKKPYISILSYRKNNAFMIEIENCFSGSLNWDQESGIPITSKEKKESHGYGLVNIRKVARKYYGDIDIVQTGEQFKLSIMLMME